MIYNNGNNFQISNSNFSKNTLSASTGYGGVIYNNGNSFQINNTNFF
ncbi:hypothetical protein [Methanobrevibacter arboriphilus]|nr:hypothetical protein [Methanobrevibacter arboriphilus]